MASSCFVYFITVLWAFCKVNGDTLKTSLTFVIDDTGSMHDEITQVKSKTNTIFDAVLKSNNSNIDDFILVTFNDPGVQLRTITKDRNLFTSALEAINVSGGGDCPEYAMTGIELALEKSKPNSNIYVYTDASSRDYALVERVKSLSLKKSIKITFLLTGECSPGEGNSLVYDNLATATSGQVFHIEKHEVNMIIDYIIDSIKSVKTLLAKQDFLGGSPKQMQFDVDSKLWDVIVSVSAKNNPNFQVFGPNGKLIEKKITSTIVDTANVKIVKIKTLPGTYTIVLQTGEASVKVTASTPLTFIHGFSPIISTSLNVTSTKPIPDEKSFLAIKLDNFKKDVALSVVELIDVDGIVIKTLPLNIINEDYQFYVTEAFLSPNRAFRLKVSGYSNSGEKIRRLGEMIEPQNVINVKQVENVPPTAIIVEGSTLNAEYDKPLNITCKLHAYPKPDVIWQDDTGSVWASTATAFDLPYDFISILHLDKINRNSTYTCQAVNSQGRKNALVKVETKRKTFLNIVEHPVDMTVGYGDTVPFNIKVDAFPPAEVTWFKGTSPIVDDDNYDISPDNLTLTVKKLVYADNFTVEISNAYHKEIVSFTVHVYAETPIIDKSKQYLAFKKGTKSVIHCNITRGYPKPKVSWSFRLHGSAEVFELDEVKDTIFIRNITNENAGTYQCNATNEIGSDSHNINVISTSPPSITNANEVVSAEEGEQIKLYCVFDGIPSPVIQWYKDGNLLTSSATYHIYGGSTVLRFQVKSHNANSTFTCVGKNQNGEAQKTIKINLGASLYIEPPEESILSLDIGSPLSLSCKTHGVPSPEVRWRFYSNSSGETTWLRPDSANSIQIKSLKYQDQGIYTCIANNTLEPLHLSYVVTVTAKPSIINAPNDNSFKGVVGDLALRIPCKAVGNPQPATSWTIDGDNLAIGVHYDVEIDGTLVIKHLTKAEEGNYKCTAENKIGSAVKEFKVEIQESPTINQDLVNIPLAEGSSVSFDCDVPHSKGDLVRWFKDQKIIAVNEFRINSAKMSDSGIYTCRVSNFLFSDSSHKRIRVGRKPTFLYEEETDIDFNKRSNAYLSCLASSDTVATVEWFHNERQLNESSMEKKVELYTSDLGRYTCKVSNIFGEITRTFNIYHQECILNIVSDFNSKQPLLVTKKYQWHRLQNVNGVIRISKGNGLPLYCPMSYITDKILTFNEKALAVCVDKSTFKIGDTLVNFSDLQCTERNSPLAKDSGISCDYSKRHTTLMSVGFNMERGVLGVYDVCFDIDNKVPVYTKHTINPLYANTVPNDFFTFNFTTSKFLPPDINSLYNCSDQIVNSGFDIRSLDTEPKEVCCYTKRQLVNPNDIIPGIAQLATYNYLNVVPQWSVFSTENWHEVEQRVRQLVKTLGESLEVWTGSSKPLFMTMAMTMYDGSKYKAGCSQGLPISPFIWKVLYRPDKNEAIAIVQLNLPVTTRPEAIKLIPCKDMCYKVDWMAGLDRYNMDKGFTICCDVQEFQKIFGYKFTNASLMLSQKLPEHSIT